MVYIVSEILCGRIHNRYGRNETKAFLEQAKIHFPSAYECTHARILYGESIQQ